MSDLKMDPDIKRLWVEALRSGNYQQTTGVLRRINPDGTEGWCCLGVLCDLAVKAKVIPEPQKGDSRYWYGNSSALPSDAVAEWAGFYGFEGINPILGAHSASGWNDGERVSFVKIADLIEEHL